MRPLILVCLLGLLSGCAFTSYSDQRVHVWRVAVGTDYQVNKMTVTTNTNSTNLKIGNIASETDIEDLVKAAVATALKKF